MITHHGKPRAAGWHEPRVGQVVFSTKHGTTGIHLIHYRPQNTPIITTYPPTHTHESKIVVTAGDGAKMEPTGTHHMSR